MSDSCAERAQCAVRACVELVSLMRAHADQIMIRRYAVVLDGRWLRTRYARCVRGLVQYDDASGGWSCADARVGSSRGYADRTCAHAASHADARMMEMRRARVGYDMSAASAVVCVGAYARVARVMRMRMSVSYGVCDNDMRMRYDERCMYGWIDDGACEFVMHAGLGVWSCAQFEFDETLIAQLRGARDGCAVRYVCAVMREMTMYVDVG